jgi:D-glycero-beta-D-manno-heptose 1-phosphate adenylyltransferase
MKHTGIIQQKIVTLTQLQKEVYRWKFLQKKIAFTNGCFDILHEGHIFSLSAAAKEGDILIVAINSDASTKRLKGNSRPVNNQQSRALLIASLVMVDAVVIFDEDTPLNVITSLLPDVLVKGGDYTVEQVVGAKEVIANGGSVVINKIVEGFSTTGLIAKMQQL